MNEVLAVTGYALTLGFIPLILSRKRDPTVALAWCLTIAFLPYVGAALYLTFGATHIARPLSRLRRHRQAYLATMARPAASDTAAPPGWGGVGELANRLGAYPCRPGNQAEFYAEGAAAFAAMEDAIRAATDHIYAEFFIWRPDAVGRHFIDLLAQRAAAGVRVRVIYDAIGSYRLSARVLRPLRDAGGHAEPFLPISLWRRRVQVSLRNHRKILCADGRVGFTGGLNLGEEYVHGGDFPYWRDTHVRLEGPVVADLERTFIEDWHFVSGELLPDPEADACVAPAGDTHVQIVTSGPDQRVNSMHEVYFTAFTRCRERLWIMSPYFVPSPALLTALRTAATLGVDVRLIAPSAPDHYLTFWAANYYWDGVLDSGVRIYRYTRGMMHSKVILADGQWGTVGTANLDIRSLRLNFEVTALFDEPAQVAVLEAQFERDLADAEELDVAKFRARPLYQKGIENFARLFSPVL